jgi:glycosyltransferase involved in cell wall biosynthesis
MTQTYKDIEVVIVDDGSTDSTEQYLQWLMKKGDNRVKIVDHSKNEGRSAARNSGNKAASGDIICVLDADDICTPSRAELTVRKFKDGAEFVHGAAHMMDAVGRDLGMMETDVFNKDKAIKSLTNGIVHSSVAMTKKLALEYPYSSGDFARLGIDDWKQQTDLYMAGVKFEYISAPLCAYRAGVGISATRDNEEVRKFKEGYLSAFKVLS